MRHQPRATPILDEDRNTSRMVQSSLCKIGRTCPVRTPGLERLLVARRSGTGLRHATGIDCERGRGAVSRRPDRYAGSHRFPQYWLTIRARQGDPESFSVMAESIQATVTSLLKELQAGNRAAFGELFPLVYDELRALAHRQRHRWRGDFTLNTTALVHEAYLKLVDQQGLQAKSRTHFLGVASKAMRHILCNYARDRLRKKRGGDLRRLNLTDIDTIPANVVLSTEQAEVLVALDDALGQLETEHQGLSDIVECRFFGAMSIEDTAAALRLSPATVKRRWILARSWLYRAMQRHSAP